MSVGPVLVATQRPRASHWQLAAPDESLAFLLVGWSLPLAADRDDGMPTTIASAFVRALLRVGKLTYLSSSAPPSSPNTQSRLMKSRGIGAQLRTALGNEPRTFWAVTTTEPEIACDLFDDPGFPWWLQGQGALITRGESLPELDRAMMLAATDPAFTVTQAALTALGAVALVRPGVDGDVAGIASPSGDVEAEIVSSLEAAATEAGMGWLLVDEESFATCLSDAGRAEVEHRLTRTLKLT